MESVHKTVLLKEAIDGLNLSPKSLVVDGTFGGGGHSLEICKRYPDARIIAIDQDKNVFTKEDKFQGCNISFVNDNFRNIEKILEKERAGEIDPVRSRPLEYESATVTSGRPASNGIDGIILDLGLSSDQLENSGRGFSFMKDEPLLMTMKENPLPEDVTAFEVVNTWEETSLADIIYGYGEEKQARRIAKQIVEFRKKQEIKTTFDLVGIIEQAIPAKFRKGKLHFATKTFQAIRSAVNDELGALSEGLEKGFRALRAGGRMSVISFHSLEDRIVKRFFKKLADEKKGKLINKKPITATKEEIKNNPRSRSAKLRIISRR